MTVNNRQDDVTDEKGSNSSSAWNHYIPFFDSTTGSDDIEKQQQSPTTQKQEQSSSSSVTPNIQQQWKTFWAMSVPYFRENSEGRCLFIGLIILMLLDSFARIFFSYLARDFWSALGDKDAEEFYFVMKEFLIALLCLAPINGYEVKRRFSNVVSVFYDLIGTQRNLEFFTTNYNYLTWILPVVVIAPQYMAGNVELGVVQQAAAAFGHILDDLSLIINQFEELSEFSASIGRLHQFVRAVRDADPDRDEYSPLMGPPPDDAHHGSSEKDGIFKKTSTPAAAAADGEEIIHNNDGGICLRQLAPLLSAAADPISSPSSAVPSTAAALSIRNLCLSTPDQNRTLIHSLDLELKWGQQLLIVGQSGIGKSSLLRAIAGLWTSGSGIIERANTSDVYFLPQKPYCPIGTLRDQLLYPFRKTVEEDEGDEKESTRITDERLLQILGDVDLSNLATRSGER
ncbi:hypothetical protein FRACYDRAFT_231840 [Fragilariopsis cylindrus CCMP1102]|uniref:ABC transporter domain-containing protein n=1 Tax=Fragilariopsis cylindrus CCMP1102 TaxID=635003 RepID=A0A1E7FUB0_9STRA|nr:hypothetical protein FRACYDRAFT_231840 [Fragilariopsis cylindrus CCMP1102]|eukprot:OEU21697.1 hypothetical protein FRACYDRAFT_231840 [Fragilariopsis cylindrus CCMP1102]